MRHHHASATTLHLSRTAAVYAAMLDSVTTRPAPDTLLVHDSTAVFTPPRPSGPSAWRARYEALPAGLLADLAATSQRRRPTTALALPRPIHLIASAEIREIFGRGLEAGWAELDRRYPRQRNILGFSPVAFSADSTEAMVYYTYSCGPECGGREVIWLSVVGVAETWQVRAKLPVASIL